MSCEKECTVEECTVEEKLNHQAYIEYLDKYNYRARANIAGEEHFGSRGETEEF